MKYLLITCLLTITSCVSSKYSYSYFVDCEKKFSEFTDLSSCALKKIQNECSNNTNCRNENTRFVDAMKRLQIMVKNNEISDNEAMFLGVVVQDVQGWSLFLRGFRQHSSHRQLCHQNLDSSAIQVSVSLSRYTFPLERFQREHF